jgi:hypothetical protein
LEIHENNDKNKQNNLPYKKEIQQQHKDYLQNIYLEIQEMDKEFEEKEL